MEAVLALGWLDLPGARFISLSRQQDPQLIASRSRERLRRRTLSEEAVRCDDRGEVPFPLRSLHRLPELPLRGVQFDHIQWLRRRQTFDRRRKDQLTGSIHLERRQAG